MEPDKSNGIQWEFFPLEKMWMQNVLGLEEAVKFEVDCEFEMRYGYNDFI